MNPPINITLGIPATLKEGRKAGISVAIDNTSGEVITDAQVFLPADWAENPALLSFGSLSVTGGSRKETVNLKVTDAGDEVFMDVFVRIQQTNGSMKVYKGHLQLNVSEVLAPADTHYHVTGKQDNTRAEKQFAGATSSDEIIINLNVPGKVSASEVRQGVQYHTLELHEIPSARWDALMAAESGGKNSPEEQPINASPDTISGQTYPAPLGGYQKKFEVRVVIGVASILAVILVAFGYKLIWSKQPVMQINHAPGQKENTLKANGTSHEYGYSTPEKVPSSEKKIPAKNVNVATPSVPRSLTVSLNKEVYQQGDIQKVMVTVPEDGYLYVASIWADGKVYVYFPHADRPSALVKKGEEIKLPPPGWKIEMEFPGNFPADEATERIEAVLSRHPLEIDPASGQPREQTAAYIRLGLLTQPYLARYRGGRMRKEAPTTKVKNIKTAGAFYTIMKP